MAGIAPVQTREIPFLMPTRNPDASGRACREILDIPICRPERRDTMDVMLQGVIRFTIETFLEQDIASCFTPVVGEILWYPEDADDPIFLTGTPGIRRHRRANSPGTRLDTL